ncbi:hypothetical protein ACROYT_G023344 [Oculina patagonica]
MKEHASGRCRKRSLMLGPLLHQVTSIDRLQSCPSQLTLPWQQYSLPLSSWTLLETALFVLLYGDIKI